MNLIAGGGNIAVRSEETKAKIRAARKGMKPNLGKKHSEESKVKMSESHKGKTAWNKGLKVK